MKMIKARIFFLIIGIFLFANIVFAENGVIYYINLNYVNGSFDEGKIYLFPDNASSTKWTSGKEFNLNAISFDNLSLYKTNLFISNDEIERKNGNVSFWLSVPYFNNSKEIQILTLENQKLLTIDVSQFSLCNQNGCSDEPISSSIGNSSDVSQDVSPDSSSDNLNSDVSQDVSPDSSNGKLKYGSSLIDLINNNTLLIFGGIILLIISIIITILIIIRNSSKPEISPA